MNSQTIDTIREALIFAYQSSIPEKDLEAALAELAALEQARAGEPNADGLLHCPFCGGQGALIEDHVLGPSEPLYSPVCEHLAYWYEHRFDPGHKGHSQCGGSAGASFANREEAIAAWNRRTTAQEQAPARPDA